MIPADIGELLGPGDWTLRAAHGAGSVGSAWVARDGDRRLFVKTGVNVALLRSVAELGVAPRVVASRDLETGPTVAQDFVDGASPSERWVDENVERVMRLMWTYHTHSALTDLVSDESPDSPQAQLALTHGDPNTSNLILTRDGRLYLVDWDLVRVSDPMRDIGPLLWWYVHADRWSPALAAAGLEDGAGVRESVYRWAAARLFEVAEWLIAHGNPAEAAEFAGDGEAARAGLANPRAWWRRT